MNIDMNPLEILRDKKFYLENFVKIKGKKPGALIPFKLKPAQLDLFNAVNENNRVIILKSRQMGFSTAMIGYFYVDTIMNPGTTTAIIGYNSDLTAELLDKVKTFYRSTPASLRPTMHYNSKYEMSFSTIDSKIVVLPSTVNVGRGYTLSNCLATELSSWENAEEKMMTLEASVPQDGKLVIESTPRGVGNLYHKMWMSKDNGYEKRKYGWHWGYTKEEIDLIRRRMNNPMNFAQEYGLEFLSSGRPVFDARLVAKHRKNVLKLGDTVTEDGVTRTIKDDDGLVMYKEPVPGRVYVVGADVAEGVEGGDFSVAVIFDRSTGEEVASYRGLLPADVFGDKLNVWGRKYNNALMVVEVNNHGLTTITVLKNKIYPALYFRPAKFETMGSPISDKIGWRTTKLTRNIIIDEFAQAFRDGDILIHTKETLDEMSVFVYNDAGNMVPMQGYHDDGIFATAIGLQGFKQVYDKALTQIDYSEYLPTNYAY